MVFIRGIYGLSIGERMAKIRELEKKADYAKQMRDFMAYKQFQKQIDKEKEGQ